MNEQRHIRRILQSTTVRLTGTYLTIIMLMSLSFSFVFYNTSARQLDKQDIPQDIVRIYQSLEKGNALRVNDELQRFLRERAREGRAELLVRLLWVNLSVLAAGSLLSYYLARRSLQPIEEAMEAQTRFVSDASHELRTPLTALQITNEVALRKPKLTTKESRELIEYNVAEVAKLKSLSDGLLGLLKQDSAITEFIAVSLQAATTEAINRVAPAALDKHMSVHDSVPNIMVRGDEAILTQILTIFLDNAVKYSPEKSEIFVEAKARSKNALIMVRDHGVGIKASELPHIFDRFYRADTSRTRQHTEGYGLGLSIARKLADQLGGEISVKSAPDKGSTFTLKLSLA
jgi:signal transduction histidine kinase